MSSQEKPKTVTFANDDMVLHYGGRLRRRSTPSGHAAHGGHRPAATHLTRSSPSVVSNRHLSHHLPPHLSVQRHFDDFALKKCKQYANLICKSKHDFFGRVSCPPSLPPPLILSLSLFPLELIEFPLDRYHHHHHLWN